MTIIFGVCCCYIDDFNVEKLFKSKENADKACAELQAKADKYHSYWVDEYELEE